MWVRNGWGEVRVRGFIHVLMGLAHRASALFLPTTHLALFLQSESTNQSVVREALLVRFADFRFRNGNKRESRVSRFSVALRPPFLVLLAPWHGCFPLDRLGSDFGLETGSN